MNWNFTYLNPGGIPDWEQLEQQCSWFRDMKDVPQDPIWHAEGDVQIHTHMVVEALMSLSEFDTLSETDKQVLVTAALLHDVEKRSTTTTEVLKGKTRIVSPKHALRGEFTTRSLLYREHPAPFAIREQVAKLVRWHGLPIWAIGKTDPKKAVIEASLVVNTQHVALLAQADMLGRIGENLDDNLLRIELFRELCRENDCYGKPFAFPSATGRFQYLNRKDTAPDYVPFEDHRLTVTVMCALPGSGKDSFIRKNLDLPMLSLDELRREAGVDHADKKGSGRIIQEGREKAREYLRKQQDFVFNATNITKDMRGKWIGLFTEYRAKVRIVYLEVPYRQLLKQNHNRDYKVPEQAVERLIDRLEIPLYKEAHEIEYLVTDPNTDG